MRINVLDVGWTGWTKNINILDTGWMGWMKNVNILDTGWTKKVNILDVGWTKALTTTVVQIVLFILVWFVQMTVVMECLGTSVGKFRHTQQLNQLLSSCAKLFWFFPTAGLSTLTMEYMVCSITSGISVKCVACAFLQAISVLEYVLLIV